MRSSPAGYRPFYEIPSAEPTIDRVRCVLLKDQRYLLARHRSRRRENRNLWGLAGGRLRECENPQDCLRRELLEELDCRVAQLIEIGDFAHGDETHRVFACEITKPIETFDARELCAIAWFTYAEVVRLAAADRLRAGFELAAITTFERRRSSQQR